MSDMPVTGRPLRFLNIVDHCRRECLASFIDFSIPAHSVIRIVDDVAASRGLVARIVSDNGSEFASRALQEWAERRGVLLCLFEPGKPSQNGFLESFNGRCRHEHLNEQTLLDLADAGRKTEAWRQHCNRERPHSRLGGLIPSEFSARAAGLESPTAPSGTLPALTRETTPTETENVA